MRLLSLSSQVVGGHVGNTALAYPLARQGVELLAVPSVVFSNHPGYGAFEGAPLPAGEVAALVEGLGKAGFLAGVDGMMTGYLGTAETAIAAAKAVCSLRGAGCRYLLDPVLGDSGRLYVAPGIERAMRERLLPLADAVTPNPFELGRLTDLPTRTPAQRLRAARALLALGPPLVLVTSTDDPPGEGAPGEGEDEAACLLATAEGAWRLATPRLAFPVAPNGAGDLLAGLLLVELCRRQPPLPAARAAMARLFRLLQATLAAGGRELAVLAADDAAPDLETVRATAL